MIVAVKKNGLCCIAADDMGISGDSRKYTSQHSGNLGRIVQVGSTYIGVERNSAVFQIIQMYFKKRKKPNFSTTEDIFEEMRILHKELKEHYHLVPAPARDDESFERWNFKLLLVNPQGIFSLCGMRSVLEISRFYAIGQGAEYAMGALEALYDRIESPKAIVQKALQVSQEFDIEVGSCGPTYEVKQK